MSSTTCLKGEQKVWVEEGDFIDEHEGTAVKTKGKAKSRILEVLLLGNITWTQEQFAEGSMQFTMGGRALEDEAVADATEEAKGLSTLCGTD